MGLDDIVASFPIGVASLIRIGGVGSIRISIHRGPGDVVFPPVLSSNVPLLCACIASTDNSRRST